jgi:hypothetical protein
MITERNSAATLAIDAFPPPFPASGHKVGSVSRKMRAARKTVAGRMPVVAANRSTACAPVAKFRPASTFALSHYGRVQVSTQWLGCDDLTFYSVAEKGGFLKVRGTKPSYCFLEI